MPGPQSATPKPVYPSRPRRRFSLQEANKALSLVGRIVADVVTANANVVRLKSRLESARDEKDQAALQQAADQLQTYVDELHDVGCELKDSNIGLVDFVGMHEGREVYLCWKLGEAAIEHWHELTGGFAARQPISTLHESL